VNHLSYVAVTGWVTANWLPRHEAHHKLIEPKAYEEKVQINMQRTMQTITAEVQRTRVNIQHADSDAFSW
jgi:hypothetical protein